MEINYFEIYTRIFSLIDSMYFANQTAYDTGNIGILLGQMDPFLCGNGSSADSAWFMEFSKKLSGIKDAGIKDGIAIIRAMLDEYDDETYNIKKYLRDFDDIIAAEDFEDY